MIYQHEENKLNRLLVIAIEGDLFNFRVHSFPFTVCNKYSHKDL